MFKFLLFAFFLDILVSFILFPATILLVGICFVVHELGHIALWKMQGINPQRIVVHPKLLGIGVKFDADESEVTARQRLWGAVGGPLASAMFGLAMMPFSPTLALMSLLFALFNLVPLPGSDGRNIIRTIGRERNS